jgi:hypothetical protein
MTPGPLGGCIKVEEVDVRGVLVLEGDRPEEADREKVEVGSRGKLALGWKTGLQEQESTVRIGAQLVA